MTEHDPSRDSASLEEGPPEKKQLRTVAGHAYVSDSDQTRPQHAVDLKDAAGDLSDLTKVVERLIPLSAPTRPGSIGRIGAYELLNVVGQGGMGVVLRAFDEQLHRNVAIKVMSSQLITSERAKQRFIREARSAASINHPNVVTIHAVSEQDGVPFLVMEYIEGRTLQERIHADAPLETIDIIRISSQMCDGLAAAHRRGIVHRDIKPSNVLLEDSVERVKITDFGLARVVCENSDFTSLGDVVGTPAYMSPEQVAGEELDGRSDLFSLGCVMYAMIAGHSPFRRKSAIATARLVKDGQHPPLRGSYDVPGFLVDVIDRLLEKDPVRRFQSADELGAVLTRHLSQFNRRTSDDATVVKDKSIVQRKKPLGSAILALGAVGMTLLAAGVFAWVAGLPSPFQNVPPPIAGAKSAIAAAARPRAPRTWTVAVKSPADHDNLQQALEAAQPGDVIEVLDDAQYTGPFFIADPKKYAELRLIARRGAVLTATTSGAVLTVANTPRVRVEGFTIVPAPEMHSIYVHSNVSGCELVNLRLQQRPGALWANVLLARECHGAPDAPLIIRDCTIESTAAHGVYVGRHDIPDALEAAHVQLVNNSFSGPATHVALHHAVRDVRIAFNVFSQGRGVSISLAGKHPSHEIVIHNNTFLGVEPWLVLGDDRRDYGGVACNNLLIGGSASLESLIGRELWHIHHNLREGEEEAASPEALPPVMTAADVGVPVRDAGAEGYLTPSPSGLAAQAGAGGDFPKFVGARAPE